MLYRISNGAVELGAELILKKINFEIRDTEKIAVVGRNGCGKTTLLRLIAGELELTKQDSDESAFIAKSGKPEIGYLTEEIEGLRFAISAHSFLQVNYEGMGLLYNTLFELLNLSGQETVVDLYCGAGTISLLAAKRAGKVFGIEIVPEAVANAKHNAAENGIKNAEFFAGDAKAEFGRIREMAGEIDVVIVDPPRKGLEAGVIDDIVSTGAKKIGYVSCDPATMARDIALFYEKGYTANAIQPVDMFPQTTHVESVVLLSQQKPDDAIELR